MEGFVGRVMITTKTLLWIIPYLQQIASVKLACTT